MTTQWLRALQGATAALLLAGASTGWAQIKIGQTVGVTGPAAATSKEANTGAQLYFDSVNAKGGVNGQKIELTTLDDKFEPKLAAENAKALIEQGVVALFLNRGTPHTQAIMPLLTEYKVPLIGPSTGAMVLHQPVHPYVFNVRATYQREAERVIHHLLLGMDRIALVHVNDSFGEDAAVGALKAFAEEKKAPVVHERYDRANPDFSQIVPKIVAAQTKAVLLVGSGAPIVDGMKAIRAAGSKAQLVTLSNNASAGFVKALGDVAYGTVVSQVFPPERSLSTPLVKELADLASAHGKVEVTPAMLDGFASAKVLVEGLRRAGPRPTPGKLKAALETFRRFDIGGLEVSYSPTDHTGLDYSDLSFVGQDGKFRR
jgi:branched-chain amino acid transport system substrate-binding protein